MYLRKDDTCRTVGTYVINCSSTSRQYLANLFKCLFVVFMYRLARCCPGPVMLRPIWNSQTCLAEQDLKETERRRFTGQWPGTKSCHSPADKQLVNWSLVGRQPVVVFHHSVCIGCFCLCFLRDVQNGCIRYSRCRSGQSSSGRSALAPYRPAPHHLARLASPRPYSEERRWEVLRSSAPKNENGGGSTIFRP